MKAPLADYPGMNPFVLDWLGGDQRFLPRATHWSEGLENRVPVSRSDDLAAALDRRNRRWGIFAEDAIARWASGQTRTIIAGQQVGFAGGPLYTLAKIASVVKMKRTLEQQGIAATAFFWLATEDHDFDEVATLNVPVREKDPRSQLDLLCMRAIRAADSRAVVGSLPVPEPLVAQLLTFFEIPRPSWLREGITFGESFAELVASLFGSEVILVDALLPELRRAGAPLFDAIEARRDTIHDALATRGKELQAAGYAEQVQPNDDGQYTLLYELDEHGHRQPPTSQPQAERTSTSALTRPLLQDFVLGPDVFVGGPAEVAYYAQIAPLHHLLGVTMPRVALRGHVLLATKRIERAMSRYAIAPAEAFTSAEALLAEREPEGVARIREIAAGGKTDLLKHVAEIGELALPADHSLAGSIQKSVGHLEFHWNKLAERAIKGLVRKDRERYAAVRDVVATLYPDRHVQDRVVSWFADFVRFGPHLVERVIEDVEPDSAFFKVAVL
jgi:uncharacterized protein YllA (UPF0747 family)